MLAEDTKRLEKIDKLYSLRLDQCVSLPMLVVVGDQSSGKSSVLEALTGLPFPRDSSLCTRFPTQVVFNRSDSQKIEISVISSEHGAGSGSGRPVKEELGCQSLDDLDEARFTKVLSDACRFIGVPTPGDGAESAAKSFSQDVLKIELSGPNYEHFSVVDLPGLFRKPTAGQTTTEDIEFVRHMVENYLKNDRAIILVIVPANVDIATQEIVRMAEDVDPDGKRTLGVLTKPDLVDKGAEDKVLDLVAGQGGHFGLGYTIVCNRSQVDFNKTIAERHLMESRFFQSEPWKTVPQHKAGIKALKIRLDKLLVDLARQNFEEVERDITQAIKECQEQLQSLGPEKANTNEQRNYLLKVSTAFQTLTAHALDAYYARDDCFVTHEELRLATLIKALEEEFSTTMRKEGHYRKFSKRGRAGRLADTTSTAQKSKDELNYQASIESSSDGGDTALKTDFPIKLAEVGSDIRRELRPALGITNSSSEGPAEDIMTWIRREYRRSQGFEIGTINPSLLRGLYQDLIKPWRYHAMTHINKVIMATHSFIVSLLKYLCHDPRIRENFWARLRDGILKSYRRAVDQADLLLEIEKQGNMRTLNHYFSITLQKMRFDRSRSRFAGFQTWTTSDEAKATFIRYNDVTYAHLSNDDQVIDELHDVLHSYYKVSRKQFVDAVTKGPVGYFLLSVNDGPLRACSPEFVGRLSDHELELIAGENDESAQTRVQIIRKLWTSNEGLKVLEG